MVALLMLEGRGLASGGDDNLVKLWDAETLQNKCILKGHHKAVTSLVELEDGRLASGSYDGTIRLWDFREGRDREDEVRSPHLSIASLPH